MGDIGIGMGRTRLIELWEELQGLNPTNEELILILDRVPSLRMAAGEELLRRSPSNDELTCIIGYLESLKTEAGRRILEQDPSEADVQTLILSVDLLKEKAQKLHKVTRRRKEIIVEMGNLSKLKG